MKETKTNRGFGIINYPSYPSGQEKRLVQASSAIGDYEDSFENPGSSYLWIGEHHHLNREEVASLIEHLKTWLETGKLDKNG